MRSTVKYMTSYFRRVILYDIACGGSWLLKDICGPRQLPQCLSMRGAFFMQDEICV